MKKKLLLLLLLFYINIKAFAQTDLYNKAVYSLNEKQAQSNKVIINQLLGRYTIVNQNMDILLRNPNNDVLYNQTENIMIECIPLQNKLGSDNSTEIKKVEWLLVEINRKSIELDKLRKSSDKVSVDANGSSGIISYNATEAFTSGFQQGLSQNMEKSQELDQAISDVQNEKEQADNELKNAADNLKKKLKSKQGEVFKQGKSYEKILFEDKNIRVLYMMKNIKSKACNNKFGYYNKATVNILNKTNKKVAIKGFIRGASSYEGSSIGLNPFGEEGECFGFWEGLHDTYWDGFYYSWNFYLEPNKSYEQTGNFWTQNANEQPAWQVADKIIK